MSLSFYVNYYFSNYHFSNYYFLDLVIFQRRADLCNQVACGIRGIARPSWPAQVNPVVFPKSKK